MTATSPVAIVGLGGLFPEAPNLEAFQHNILHRVDACTEVPAGRWIVDSRDVHDDRFSPDTTYSKRGCFVGDFDFDPSGLNLDPDTLHGLDPLYKMVLHVGRQALDDAVIAGLDRARMGVVLASIALPTDGASALTRELFDRSFAEALFDDAGPTDEPHASSPLNARVAALPASLLAQALHLGGGSYTLDAACASSLYAVKLACEELIAGRADAMLAGGASRPECLYTQMGFSQLRALSPSGVCRPFDARADGLVVGEGAGIVVLKRLDDALSDGDHVYGVIRGIGLSNDIAGSLLAADAEGQLRAMIDAYRQANWSPRDVDLIECHGTGTPLGDAVEIESLRSLWGRDAWQSGQCAIGSIKSNIGHLLTAAGAAGLIKTLLAIRDRQIPPSLNFEQAPAGTGLEKSPFRVQWAAQPWDRRNHKTPRRAAVSAFGFGGINAHLLVEEWDPSIQKKAGSVRRGTPIPSPGNATPIAIVGMDARVGRLNSLREFQELVLGGGSIIGLRPADRWHGCDEIAAERLGPGGQEMPGAFVESVAVAVGEFRLPPNEISEVLPQQLLMLQSVANALKDAGKNSRDRDERTGVIVGMGLDLNTTNFHHRWWLLPRARRWMQSLGLELNDQRFAGWVDALREQSGPALTPGRVLGALGNIIASRIAREFSFGGPSFAVSAEEASGVRALEIAVRALQRRELDTAVVGAVDLPGDVRHVLATHAVRPYSTRGQVRPFDVSADGTVVGEGAVSVVLKRLPDAIKADDRIYAVVRGLGFASGGGADATSETYRTAMKRAYRDADLPPNSIQYLETHGSGDPREDRVEAEALAGFFDAPVDGPRTIGSVKPNIGHTGAAAGLASLVKASLCLYHEILPALEGHETPCAPEAWKNGRFHAPNTPRFWLRDRADGPRRASVSVMTLDGGCAHVVLESGEGNTRPDPIDRRQPLGARATAVFGVTGDDVSSLSDGLASLRQSAKSASGGIERLARSWFDRVGEDCTGHKLALAIVARDRDELVRAVTDAEQRLHTDASSEIRGRHGVFYSPKPLGPRGQVAFVFPGSGNHYEGMGRGVAVHWPEVLRSLDAETERLKSQMMPHLFEPEGCGRGADGVPLGTIFSQVSHGIVMSDLLRALGVEPSAAIGYSLGESTAMFAMRAWRDRDEMFRRMRESPLFQSELVGRCDAARKAWGLGKDELVEWCAAVVNRPAVQVRDALTQVERAYLLITNTPEECVVGGWRNDVDQVIAALGCEAVELSGTSTVHCPVAHSVKDAYRRLHLLTTTPPPDVRFYSAAAASAYDVTSKSAADSIVEQAMFGFEFPALIERAYADGVRVFVEPGPQASCSRMIGRILADRPHVARSACVEGEDDVATVLNVVASMYAERVISDLSPLYGCQTRVVDHQSLHDGESNRERIIVRTGGPKPQPRLPESIDAIERTPAPPFAKQRVGNWPRKSEPVKPGVATELTAAVAAAGAATVSAHDTFLRFSQRAITGMGKALALQSRLLGIVGPGALRSVAPSSDSQPDVHVAPAPMFDRDMCMEFAVGSVAKVLGTEFAVVDSYPVRVRLPDEPLMLVDRILAVEGDKRSLTSGRVVTEHDVLPGAWYLDGNRAPVCIAVEAGQADLFLCAYLGIDLAVKGRRSYRLLDATVTFHRGLPQPGEVVRYDIHIDRFVRRGDTYLFFFRFEGTVDGQPLLSMADGCAGFFTEREIAESGGIVQTADESAPVPGKKPDDWRDLVPMRVESYDEKGLEALRRGDLAACFGSAFEGIKPADSLRIPGGRMRLIDRVTELDPKGGRFGLGLIRAEADIQGDEWFLTCHFVDDMVMPGTLMHECCTHALRILLLRMGWVTERNGACYEPLIGVPSKLCCRGPVTPATRVVTYEVRIKEIGYRPEPYVIADALMYADTEKIVQFTDMSLRMTGVTRGDIESVWRTNEHAPSFAMQTVGDTPVATVAKPAIFDTDRILAFAVGNPSEAFGEPYRPFDADRRIARLPGPPYNFLDRITEIHAEAWHLAPGGWIEAQYDVPPDAWYFKSNRQRSMPFAVLLEIALQPCGWLAAYLGSALRSVTDLSFRNLSGEAVLFEEVFSDAGTLTTRVRITKVSEAGGMMIESFDIQIWRGGRIVYDGDTTFGFFSADALAQQVGVRDAAARQYTPDPDERRREKSIAPASLNVRGLPDSRLRMIDAIDVFVPDGGPHGLGFIRGVKQVDPDEWFFAAHFHQDPVCPGSLGLESFLQLLKVVAVQRWGESLLRTHRFEPIVVGTAHRWIYRGQVIPGNERIEVEAAVTRIEDGTRPTVVANGFLKVDGVPIYEMIDFGIRLVLDD